MCLITRKYGTYKPRIMPMVLGTFEWWQLEKRQNSAFCAKLPLFLDPIIFIVAPLLERVNNVWDCSWQISYKMDHTWKFIISGILIHLRIKVMALWISLYICIGSHAFAMFSRKKFSGYLDTLCQCDLEVCWLIMKAYLLAYPYERGNWLCIVCDSDRTCIFQGNHIGRIFEYTIDLSMKMSLKPPGVSWYSIVGWNVTRR